MDFHDRRSNSNPGPEDFDRPLTKTSITEANKRFRENGVQAVVGKDNNAADRVVKRSVRDRFEARQRGMEDFVSVGEYLEWLNSRVGNDDT